MSVLDKVVAAITPPESDDARAQARADARAAAGPGDWLSLILEQHVELEGAFEAVKAASEGTTRQIALKKVAVLLVGHSTAEETVLYPAMALADQKAHAEMGYNEQSLVKIQMAALETLDPLSQDYLDKLEHIRGALLHHMYQEEGTWFLGLKKDASAADQARLTQRYTEEYERYVGNDAQDAIGPDGGRRVPYSEAGARGATP